MIQKLRQKKRKNSKKQKQALSLIPAHLQYGDIKKICESTDYSRSTVKRHLCGKPYEEATVQAALRLIEGRMRKTHKIEERAKRLNA